MFTDNFFTERAFSRGTSSTRELNDLVFRLRELEMKGCLFINLIWVAGTRMIDQGIDGLSRADLENGVMTGKSMLDFILIHSTALERSTRMLTQNIGSIQRTRKQRPSFGLQHLRLPMLRWINYSRRDTHDLMSFISC